MNQHRTICDTIQARDAEAAAQAMADHLQTVLSSYQSTQEAETSPKAPGAEINPNIPTSAGR